MDLAGLAWRDAILFAVALAAVYLVFMLLRLTQIGRRKPAAAATTAPEPVLGAEEDEADDDEEDWLPPQVYEKPQVAPAPTQAFDAHLLRSALEAEIQALKAEAARLAEELARQREEMDHLKAARHISPQYSEAMSLAQSGHEAGSIANRCGISIGEAELVAALARNVNLNEDDHVGITDYPPSGRKL